VKAFCDGGGKAVGKNSALSAGAKEDAPFGDDDIYGHIVGLRRDAGDDLNFQSDSDFEGIFRQRLEEAVIVTQAPPQSVATFVKGAPWDDDEADFFGGNEGARGFGFTDAEGADLQIGIQAGDAAKFQSLLADEGARQGDGQTSFLPPADEGHDVGFVGHRHVKRRQTWLYGQQERPHPLQGKLRSPGYFAGR
jgi:hypothetical protein